MNLTEYQDAVKETQNHKLNGADSLASGALGLAGNVGEVVEDIQYYLFQDHNVSKEQLAKELANTLWYLSFLADALGISLEELAGQSINIRKTKKGNKGEYVGWGEK